MFIYSEIYILTPYWVGLSVCSFVTESTFPLFQFQDYAHIRNPHGPAEVLRPSGAPKAPEVWRPKVGAS